MKFTTLTILALALCAASAMAAAPPDPDKGGVTAANTGQVSTADNACDTVSVAFAAPIPHVAAIDTAGDTCTIDACQGQAVHLVAMRVAMRDELREPQPTRQATASKVCSYGQPMLWQKSPPAFPRLC